MSLGTTPDGLPYLNLRGKDGKLRVLLTTTPDGLPYLSLRDAKGKVIWQAPKE